MRCLAFDELGCGVATAGRGDPFLDLIAGPVAFGGELFDRPEDGDGGSFEVTAHYGGFELLGCFVGGGDDAFEG